MPAFLPVQDVCLPLGPGAGAHRRDRQRAWGASSYAASGQAFGTTNPQGVITSFYGGVRMADSFRDGTSNTILFAEKYARCNATGSLWGWTTYPSTGCRSSPSPSSGQRPSAPPRSSSRSPRRT